MWRQSLAWLRSDECHHLCRVLADMRRWAGTRTALTPDFIDARVAPFLQPAEVHELVCGSKDHIMSVHVDTGHVTWERRFGRLYRATCWGVAIGALSPRASYVVVGHSGASLSKINVITGKLVWTVTVECGKHFPRINSIVYSPSGESLAVSIGNSQGSQANDRVWIIKTQTGQLFWKVDIDGPCALAYSPCGASLAVVSNGFATSSITLLRVHKKDTIDLCDEVRGKLTTLIYSPCGRKVVAGLQHPFKLTVVLLSLDGGTKQEMWQRGADDSMAFVGVTQLAYSFCSKFLAIVYGYNLYDDDGNPRQACFSTGLVSIASGTELCRNTFEMNLFSAIPLVTFSSCGMYIGVSAPDGTVQLFRLPLADDLQLIVDASFTGVAGGMEEVWRIEGHYKDVQFISCAQIQEYKDVQFISCAQIQEYKDLAKAPCVSVIQECLHNEPAAEHDPSDEAVAEVMWTQNIEYSLHIAPSHGMSSFDSWTSQFSGSTSIDIDENISTAHMATSLEFGDKIMLLKFTRCGKELTSALHKGSELETVRAAMVEAGHGCRLKSGASIFVYPQQYASIMSVLSDFRLRPHHAVVAEAFLPLVFQEIKKIPSKRNVRPASAREFAIVEGDLGEAICVVDHTFYNANPQRLRNAASVTQSTSEAPPNRSANCRRFLGVTPDV